MIEPTDTIVMMSGLTPDRGRDFHALMDNLRMAESVCKALARVKCGHFIYISSEAVYDADKTPLDEDSSREPLDLYALTHTAREMMLNSILSGQGGSLLHFASDQYLRPGGHARQLWAKPVRAHRARRGPHHPFWPG